MFLISYTENEIVKPHLRKLICERILNLLEFNVNELNLCLNIDKISGVYI
jgi:hypothetical protein